MRLRLDGLWHNRDFKWLWAGQTVSVFGSMTTRVALPFTAIVYLDARTLHVALLTSADVLAGIVVGLAAGVWVDRLPKRPIMIAADIGRVVLIGSIPLAAVLGVLRIEQLYAVAFLAGAATMFFDVAYQSYLPVLVEADELIEGNSKLAASAAVSEFGAFSAAGWLVQLITAPGAMFVDALSFLVSAASLSAIGKREPPPRPPETHEPMLVEIKEGLRAVVHDSLLRPLAGSMLCLSLARGMIGAVYVLFVTRDLDVSPGVQGMIYGVGGVASLGGALLADRCNRAFGTGRSMIFGMGCVSIGTMLLVGAPDALAVIIAIMVAQQLIGDPGATVYEINEISLRQAIAPERLIGRVNSAVRFGALVAMLVGSVIAGVVADRIGARVVLAGGAGAELLGGAWLVLSPLRSLREAPVVVREVSPAVPSA